MRATESVRDTRVALDLIRGVAALLVATGHLRNVTLIDFSDVAHWSPLVKAAYFLTGFGHTAVLIFFVLSGYLVGGGALRARDEGRWSFLSYAIDRVVRLWVVILPALAIGLALDQLGLATTSPHPLYFHSPAWGNVVPDVARASRWGVTLAGNAFFMQTVLVPVLGSNGPLWSLANEAAYYLLFGLALEAFGGGSIRRRAVAGIVGLAATAALAHFNRGILEGGILWLAGVLVARIPLQRSAAVVIAALVTGATFAVIASATRVGHGVGDTPLGLAFALFLLFVVKGGTPALSRWRSLAFVATRLSQVSFTLYAFHMPLVAFIVARTLRARLSPDLIGCAAYGAIFTATFAYAVAMWWLFERRTDTIRARVRRVLGVVSVASPSPNA